MKVLRRVAGIALIYFTMLFEWHTELATSFKINFTFTNGYGLYDGVEVYHIMLWAMQLVVLLCAYLLVSCD